MPSKSILTPSLSPELTTLIAAKVASGHYRSASEVVRAALRLLVEQDRHGHSDAATKTGKQRDVR